MNGEARILTAPVLGSRSRVLDYIELTKPELTILSVLTALCGYYLGTAETLHVWGFIHAALGTALVGGGAGALNQYIERHYDALMKRTERRPIPAGRVAPSEGLVFGMVIAALGVVELTVFTNALTGFLAIITLTSYLFLYTPLKRMTPFATIVGGIPGALPPMMGWTAIRGEITLEAWVLFAILFCWQIPHFLSLAWLYRKDYARAGFKMLAAVDDSGIRTARQILMYCSILIPASGAAVFAGLTGWVYLAGAAFLGFAFLAVGIAFARSLSGSPLAEPVRANHYSRRIFLASLVYLPALLALMTLDKV